MAKKVIKKKKIVVPKENIAKEVPKEPKVVRGVWTSRRKPNA